MDMGYSQKHASAFASPPRVATNDFWRKTWIWRGQRLGSRMARAEYSPKRWNGATSKTE